MTAREYFGLPIRFPKLYSMKGIGARYYKSTYNKILSQVINGDLIHGDETSVRLQRDAGYVWVFTNMEAAVFMFRPTRNADFLQPLLRDFQGILVTDFFAGYDSLPCGQQKCIVLSIWSETSTMRCLGTRLTTSLEPWHKPLAR